MIGAIVNAYRGIKENNELKNRQYALVRELNESDSIDKLLAQIGDPYERLLAKNQLTLAEYMNERQTGHSIRTLKNIWGLVKKQMVANIAETEQQLNNIQATKLDIARIVATISQLSNELDLELEEVKQRTPLSEELQKKIKELQSYPLISALQKQATEQNLDLSEIKQHINQFTEEYSRFKAQYIQEAGQNQLGATLLQHRLNKTSEELTLLEGKHTDHTAAYAQFKKATNDGIVRLKKQDEDTHVKIDSLAKELHKAADDLSCLQAIVEKRTAAFESQLEAQRQQWTARADELDQSIQEQYTLLKKNMLMLTVPLYVMIVGVIIALFII